MAGEPLKIWRATFKVDEIAKVRAQIERLQAKLARLTSKRKP
jgi:ubiquinone biosynthesis protein UbiJ